MHEALIVILCVVAGIATFVFKGAIHRWSRRNQRSRSDGGLG